MFAIFQPTVITYCKVLGFQKKIYCKEFTPKGPIPPEFNGLLSVPNNPDHQGICRAIFQILPHKKKKLFPFLQFLHPTIIFIFYTEKSRFLMSETKKSTLQLFGSKSQFIHNFLQRKEIKPKVLFPQNLELTIFYVIEILYVVVFFMKIYDCNHGKQNLQFTMIAMSDI